MSGKVSKWLDDLELGQYTAAFEENDIGWDLLGEIDQSGHDVPGAWCAWGARLNYR
jgi:hypothetical protein